MTDDPGKQSEEAQNAPQQPAGEPAEPETHRFNPFIHEDDMFKVVLAVGAACLFTIVVVFALRAIF